MNVDALAQLMGGLVPYGIVAFIGLIVTILCAVLLYTGRKLNPAIAALGPALTALATPVVAWWTLGEAQALVAAGNADAAYESLRLVTVLRFGGWLGMSAVAVFGLLLFGIKGALKKLDGVVVPLRKAG